MQRARSAGEDRVAALRTSYPEAVGLDDCPSKRRQDAARSARVHAQHLGVTLSSAADRPHGRTRVPPRHLFL